MKQRVPVEGAYYLSYGLFQGIYRFLERTLCRDKYKDDLKSVYVILFTLSEKESGILKPENQTESTKDIILQHSFPLQASETKDGQSSTSERFCQRKQSYTEKC